MASLKKQFADTKMRLQEVEATLKQTENELANCRTKQTETEAKLLDKDFVAKQLTEQHEEYELQIQTLTSDHFNLFFYLLLGPVGRAGRRIRRFEFYISPGDPGAGVYRYSKVKHVYLWKHIKENK